MEFVNIVIPNVLIFVNINFYRPIEFVIWWNSVGPIMHNEIRPLGEILRTDAYTPRHGWHYINALFSEAAWHFQI